MSAGFIGTVAGVHATLLALLWQRYDVRVWAVYALVMACFHFMEFLLTAYGQPGTVSADSFLLNHSMAYGVACVLGWTEYWLHAWLGTVNRGEWWYISVAGLAVCTAGQLLRSLAMYQAGVSFTHLIADRKEDRHVLVTHGVYAFFRHPAYLGWFLWSIGTQVLLCNPLCTVLYTIASWRFFSDRIPYEEYSLLTFFGPAYVQYCKSTIIGIPWVDSPGRSTSKEQAEVMQKEHESTEAKTR